MDSGRIGGKKNGLCLASWVGFWWRILSLGVFSAQRCGNLNIFLTWPYIITAAEFTLATRLIYSYWKHSKNPPNGQFNRKPTDCEDIPHFFLKDTYKDSRTSVKFWLINFNCLGLKNPQKVQQPPGFHWGTPVPSSKTSSKIRASRGRLSDLPRCSPPWIGRRGWVFQRGVEMISGDDYPTIVGWC